MKVFSPTEVFEIAEQIERNGAKFYRKAADGAAKEKAPFLLDLADMEVDHEKTFRQMRDQLPTKEGTYDPDGQAAAYIQALVEGEVFDPDADPSENLTGEETVDEILRTAIALERDSIIFYLGVKDLACEGAESKTIDSIIAEEMSHIKLLSGQLSSLTG